MSNIFSVAELQEIWSIY